MMDVAQVHKIQKIFDMPVDESNIQRRVCKFRC